LGQGHDVSPEGTLCEPVEVDLKREESLRQAFKLAIVVVKRHRSHCDLVHEDRTYTAEWSLGIHLKDALHLRRSLVKLKSATGRKRYTFSFTLFTSP
jgi:hypothetical protein